MRRQPEIHTNDANDSENERDNNSILCSIRRGNPEAGDARPRTPAQSFHESSS